MWKLWFLIILLILILFPIAMDKLIIGNKIVSNISNSEWIGFLGSYVGSIIGVAGAIGTVFLNQKIEEKKEIQGLEIYLNEILELNLNNEEKDLKKILNNLLYQKNPFEYISDKIYEENFLKIISHKKYRLISAIYIKQQEIKEIIKNSENKIYGEMGNLKIIPFENLKKYMNQDIEEFEKIDLILEMISLFIDENSEERLNNYFKVKKVKESEEDELRKYFQKNISEIDRLKNLRKLITNQLIMEYSQKINSKLNPYEFNTQNSMLTLELRRTLELIESYAEKIEEYYVLLEDFFER